MQLDPPVTDFEIEMIAQAYFDSFNESEQTFINMSNIKKEIQTGMYAHVVLVFRAGVQHGRTLVNPSL